VANARKYMLVRKPISAADRPVSAAIFGASTAVIVLYRYDRKKPSANGRKTLAISSDGEESGRTVFD
jgi:hypothetical protein